MARLIGDETIFDLISECKIEEFFEDIFNVAFCWDIYGLPDGSISPYRGKDWHATVIPSRIDLISSFDVVLKEILPESELWLLDIPCRVMRLHSLDARCYVTSDKRCAIILPFGAFGNLFGINEIFFESRLNQRTKTILRPLECVLGDYIAGLLLGEKRSKTNSIFDSKVNEAISSYFFVERENVRYHPRKKDLIWATTTCQQLFLLLHEFGHIVCEDIEVTKYLPFRPLHFSDIDQEIRADAWTMNYLKRMLPFKLEMLNHQLKLTSLYIMFLTLEILRKGGHINLEYSIIAKRYNEISRIICDLGIDSASEFQTPKIFPSSDIAGKEFLGL